jgi:hypothetical protein
MIERATDTVIALVDRLPALDYKNLLFPPLWTGLTRIYLGMAVSLLLFGFFYPYWRFADMDFMLAYQGLLFNDGRPQEYFDHTAYPYYLAVGAWYWLCHWLGVLPIHALSELPSSRDVAAFEAAWQHLVEAGRVFSLLLSGLFVGIFTVGVRRFVGDQRIAILAGFALAYSGSVAMHMRIMRTELMSAGFAITALIAVLVATRDDLQARWRPIVLAAAGLCATLAVVTKIQAFLLVVAIPAIALGFGRRPHGTARDDVNGGPAIGWRWAAPLALGALALAIPATALFLQGLAETARSIYQYQPLGVVPAGTYQALVALWVMLAMVAYAAMRRVPLTDTVAALAAVLIGVSLGLLSLEIRFHEQNLLAVTHPIEHLFVFATSSFHDLAQEPQVLSRNLFTLLLQGFGSAMAEHSFVLHPSSRPTLMLEWLAIAGAVVLWRRGERALPSQIGLLLLITWGLDTVFTLRGLKLEYFVYTDPILIIAAALVAVRFPELQSSLRAQKIAACVLILYVVWGHLEPVKPLLSRSGPQDACQWIPLYLKSVETFPFCQT